MLIEFNIDNFLSFRNPTTLSMETGKYLKKHADTHVIRKSGQALLKNVNIFGPNGSGKSNLITALKVFADMVLDPTDDIAEELPYLPFRLDDGSDNRETTFSIKFIKDSTIYSYSVSYVSEAILSEELSLVSSTGREEVYFKRTTHESDNILPPHLKDILKGVRKNRLLLFEGHDKNDKVCISVFQWFHSTLSFERAFKSRRLFHLVKEDGDKKRLFLKLLNLADFNIVDIEVIETVESVPEEMKKLMSYVSSGEAPIPKKITSLDVYSFYKKYDSQGRMIGREKIPYEMESSGTQKMMAVALVLLDSLDKDRVIIMDEFDDSFHLSLTKSLLDIINSSSNTNQFIFTSHNLELLDEQLRVDQIYLTEKDFLGNTDLFSLFDFNDIKGVSRSDISFAKRYLDGQFGAMPDIDVDGMKALFEEV